MMNLVSMAYTSRIVYARNTVCSKSRCIGQALQQHRYVPRGRSLRHLVTHCSSSNGATEPLDEEEEAGDLLIPECV